jgi:HEPN domain-containing protein
MKLVKPLTLEWVRKAEGDFEVMEREARARSPGVRDSVCFHAQQCAEKYLKARLYEAGVPFEPIHKLVALLDRALAIEPLWEAYREDLAFLSNFAVAFRYPGESATPAQALAARTRCRRFRHAARAALGLERQGKLAARRKRR